MPTNVIAVVDDDESVLQSLEVLLEQYDFPVKTFGSARALLNWISPALEAIVVTDIRMPEMDGMALIAALRACQCYQPVVVITGHGDIPLAIEAMKAGVADFFEKPFGPDDLVASLNRVSAGLAGARQGNSQRNEALQRIRSLSPREAQVLNELVTGKSNKMIAASLGISPRTVEIYRANVMMKMSAASLSQLVRMHILSEAA